MLLELISCRVESERTLGNSASLSALGSACVRKTAVNHARQWINVPPFFYAATFVLHIQANSPEKMAVARDIMKTKMKGKSRILHFYRVVQRHYTPHSSCS